MAPSQSVLSNYGTVFAHMGLLPKSQCEKELHQTKKDALHFDLDQRKETKGLFWCERALRKRPHPIGEIMIREKNFKMLLLPQTEELYKLAPVHMQESLFHLSLYSNRATKRRAEGKRTCKTLHKQLQRPRTINARRQRCRDGRLCPSIHLWPLGSLWGS